MSAEQKRQPPVGLTRNAGNFWQPKGTKGNQNKPTYTKITRVLVYVILPELGRH